MKRLVQLPGLTNEMWDDTHDEKMLEFLSTNDKKTLIVFINEENGKSNLVCQNEMPTNPMELFVYFTKTHYVQEINSKELFQKNIQFGAFNGKHLTSLLRLTSGLYAPLFFGNDTWPDSKKITLFFKKSKKILILFFTAIKSDFSGQLHRFLASLTDTRWKMEGVTVLYIPKEGSNLSVEEAAKNKELVQRLDSNITFKFFCLF